MCFYLLKRKSGLEPTMIREIFLEKPALNGKTPSKSRGTNVVTLLSDSEGSVAPETACHRLSRRKYTSIHRK